METKTAAPALPRPPLMPRDAGVPVPGVTGDGPEAGLPLGLPAEAVGGAAGGLAGAAVADDKVRGLLQGLGLGAGAVGGGRLLMPDDGEPDLKTLLGVLAGGGLGYVGGGLAADAVGRGRGRGVLDDDEPEKAAAAHPALTQLLLAKAYSDRKQYLRKHAVLRQLIADSPADFFIDSRGADGIVGLTHRPTSFKIHMPGHMAPAGVTLAEEIPDPVEKAAGRLLGLFQAARGAAAPVVQAAAWTGNRAVDAVKSWPGLNRGGRLEGVTPFSRNAMPLYMPKTPTTSTIPWAVGSVPFTGGAAARAATQMKVLAHKVHGYTPQGVVGRTVNRALNTVASGSAVGNAVVNGGRIARQALTTSPLKIPLHFVDRRLGRIANPVSAAGAVGYSGHRLLSKAPDAVTDDLRAAGVTDEAALSRQWWRTYAGQIPAVRGAVMPAALGGDDTAVGRAVGRTVGSVRPEDVGRRDLPAAAGRLAADPLAAFQPGDPVQAVRKPVSVLQPPQVAAAQYIASRTGEAALQGAAPAFQREMESAGREVVADPAQISRSPIAAGYLGSVDPDLAARPEVAARVVERMFGSAMADPAAAAQALAGLPPDAPPVLRTYLQSRAGGGQ